MIFAVVSQTEIIGVPNASMIPIMWDWFQSKLPTDDSVEITNLSEETSIIALQGPKSRAILESVLGQDNHVGRFKWQEIVSNDLAISGWIQGTGYTGESGYEIFIPNVQAAILWRALLDGGATPVGLGARDTLRLEKGYLLSGWISAGLVFPNQQNSCQEILGRQMFLSVLTSDMNSLVKKG